MVDLEGTEVIYEFVSVSKNNTLEPYVIIAPSSFWSLETNFNLSEYRLVLFLGSFPPAISM